MSIPRQSPSVLVLDHLQDERDMYVEYLRTSGFEVRAQPSTEGALAAIATTRPDVVVVRLSPRVPDCRTTEVVRRLKDCASGHVPVVVITSAPLSTDTGVRANPQCDSHLLLPVAPDDLVSTIRRVLR